MKIKLLNLTLALAAMVTTVFGQIPKPADTFGFEPGADYKMATYDQMLSYYEKLDASTDRVKVTEIGKSVRGRPIKLIFISSEENMKSLDKWKSISEKMARGRISENEAKQLAKEGKAIIWFDGGMHASEKAHAQMTPELLYRIAAEESDEMKQIRDNVVTLVVPVINPDGLDIEGASDRIAVGLVFGQCAGRVFASQVGNAAHDGSFTLSRSSTQMPRKRGSFTAGSMARGENPLSVEIVSGITPPATTGNSTSTAWPGTSA
jgi:hypothetical protein